MALRDATPDASGSQIDPAVASTPSGQRLIAATDANGPGPPAVRVWKREVNANGDVTWPDTTVPGGARQPSIAWNGGGTAQLATASNAACPSAAGISVWPYNVGARTLPATPTATVVPFGGGLQSWPRVVLGDPADDTRPGNPIVVADEEACGTGKHQVVIAWQLDPANPSVFVTRLVDLGRYPDVAVLGPGANGGVTGTKLAIAYLSEPNGGGATSQDVLVRICTVSGSLTSDCATASSTRLDTITPPGPITAAGKTINAVAAPSISCDAVACHVVWTESDGGGGSRSRVLYRSAPGPSYSTWSPAVPVASSAGSSASQLMPSVAANGTRADIVYLDTRNDTFEAFQTSISGITRSRDITLNGPAGYAPKPGASLGERTDVTEYNFPDAKHAVVSSYFPDANGPDLGTVSEAELAHGTTPPSLPVAPSTLIVGKNASVNVSSWLNWSDPDGDPVTFTVDDPSHGSIASSLYSPDLTYAGADTVTARASDGVFSQVVAAHPVTVTNQAPVLDAPAPAIVDEGGAIVTVPLHAVDPDANDAIVYSVAYAESPLNVAGRATIVGATLRLDIPAGVRAMAPLRITLRARDTTTGLPALDDYQDLSVTIRPDLATPSTVPSFHVTGSRATLSAPVTWVDPSNGCLKSVPVGCHVRRVWSFGDGTPSVTTTDQPSIDHPYPRAGRYSGQVTTWILWGGSQVASDPKPFTVPIQDDGRVIAAITPKRVVKRGKTNRQVQLVITARATGSVWISINVGGKLLNKKQVKLVAGKAVPVNINVSIKGLHSHRATIRLYGWGMVASSIPPTDVYRAIILR